MENHRNLISDLSNVLKKINPEDMDKIFADAKIEMLKTKPIFAPELFDRVESFDYQINGLLDMGYHDLGGVSKDTFVKLIEPLRAKIPKSIYSSAEIFLILLLFQIVLFL